MRWSLPLGITVAASAVLGSYIPGPAQVKISVEDVASRSPRPWYERASEDATGHLIFQSLASLMQMKPNSRYSNGHSIVRATIPAGTLLYHGRWSNVTPIMDWIAFDPEHSHIFARGDEGTLFTFSTTRELNLVYFDGASANKLPGVVDSQDILLWGNITDANNRSGRMVNDFLRIGAACEWGKEYGVDGYIRMEFDFEIMYCDFSRGLQLVSALPVVSSSRGFGGVPRQKEGEDQEWIYDQTEGLFSGGPVPRRPPGVPPNPTPPKGWKGSLPESGIFEAMHAGTWHNDVPGEVRVRVDPSTMVTFYDPSLTSLVMSRRGLKRDEYRLLNISTADIAQVRQDFADALTRPTSERSGVDWMGLAQVLMDRFSDRLPYWRFLLHQPTNNASSQAEAFRKQLIVSLLPYMPRTGVEEFDQWISRIAHSCSVSCTSYLPATLMTKQEKVLRTATEDVMHEICRVLALAWSEAFDVEEQSADVAEKRLMRWKQSIDGLIEWLDWPVWRKCEPTCRVDEMCYVPQNSPFSRGPQGSTPRCVSLTKGTWR